VLTKTFWKPLSENTIFVTDDNVTKRRDHEEMVVKVFYLENITKVQDLQEIATAVRSVTDIRRFFPYNAQNALVVRDTIDKVLLAEKLIRDLDKPLPEVVVDVIVMEANRSRTRDLAAAIMSAGKAGLSIPVTYAPGGRAPATGQDGTSTGVGTGTGTGSGSTSVLTPLGQIGKLTENDWSATLPGALLQALMTDRLTRILQRPQVRAADGQKASLRLGDRFPYATGSFQPGVGAIGVSPLVSTQFQFADVGVNVDITPKIHGDSEISMHVEIEISAVRDRIDVGGLSQPVIGQRKVTADIRVRDGEVTLLGGLSQDQTTRSRSGFPGLGDIPLIRWLGFSTDSKERNEGELLIALIPRIVRRPEIEEVNLRGVAAGTDQVVKVTMLPPAEGAPAAPVKPAPAPAEPPAPEAEKPPREEPPKPAEPEAPAGARLRFNPAQVSVKRGATFTVALALENATDVFNVPIRIKFDPRMLRLNEVERGGLFVADGQEAIFTRNILNDTGDAAVILNRMPGTRGISGSGTLVNLVFQAVEAGATEVRLAEITVRNSEMGPIPVEAPVLAVKIE
jgi:general secretion pathway protein D